MADDAKRANEVRAERALIGCMLIDTGCIEGVKISQEYFQDPYASVLFRELKRMGDIGETADDTVLRSRISAEEIPDDFFWDIIGGCLDLTASSVEAERYAKIIFDGYRERQLRKLMASDPTNDEIIHKVEQLTYSTKSMSLADLAAEFEGKKFTKDNDPGYATGYKDYDRLLGGLHKGDVSIVAARPSVGKTAFALEIMLNMAKSGVKVAFFSLEMSREQVFNRLAAHESGIDSGRIQSAQSFTCAQEEKMFKAGNSSLKALTDALIIDDVYSAEDIAAKARGREVIFVDYAQLIKPGGKYKGNRYAEVGDISHEMTRIAKRNRLHVVLLSQLNRLSTTSATKEPSMSELREGGDLEQDAAQVTVLWDGNDERSLKNIKVDKNRHGKTGKLQMKFDGAVNSFSPLTALEVQQMKKMEKWQRGGTPFDEL